MNRDRPRICATITDADAGSLRKIERLVDLYEVRIDLIGTDWRKVVGHLKKLWIACNRRREEGGRWSGSEPRRIKELLDAIEMGAGIIDIELETPGVEKIIGKIKGRAECLVSYHDSQGTPSPGKLREIIRNELAAGGDICKAATTAYTVQDNLNVLRLMAEFPDNKIVAFAMGEAGQISRILCPLVGGYFTYASVGEGRESAAGQMTVKDLRKIYGLLKG
ncbi:MAG: hypothetical protein A2Z29_10815 [Chloroflexi bacterium RBG_16_56_11]|nr:MAG: hypothetical protein A2Z29_10815 [Chloroflexi bacterium RBG_16_56_11]